MATRTLVGRGADPMEHIRDRFIHVMHLIQQKFKNVRSVKAFAEAINAPYVSIYRIDKYEGYPTAENIYYLRKVFNVSTEWIYIGHGQPFGDLEITARIDGLEKRVDSLEKKAKNNGNKSGKN